MTTTHIKANVIRDNPWWVADFTVNGHEYGTQARRLDLLEEEIKDAAALITNQNPENFTISLAINTPQYMTLVDEYKKTATTAKKAEEEAAQTSRKTVALLREATLSMRDIGRLMGISVQRVSQLAKES